MSGSSMQCIRRFRPEKNANSNTMKYNQKRMHKAWVWQNYSAMQDIQLLKYGSYIRYDFFTSGLTPKGPIVHCSGKTKLNTVAQTSLYRSWYSSFLCLLWEFFVLFVCRKWLSHIENNNSICYLYSTLPLPFLVLSHSVIFDVSNL